MKKKNMIYLLLGICMLSLLLMMLFRTPKTAESLPADGGEYSAQLDQLKSMLPSGEGMTVACGSLVAERTGRDTLRFSLPYQVAQLKTVGTAGTTHWMLELGVVSMEEKNGELAETDAPAFGQVQLEVQAGQNTGLHLDGSPNAGSHIIEEMSRTDQRPDGGYAAAVSAAAIDSQVLPNETCTAQITWTGDLAGVSFTCEAYGSYLNNLVQTQAE